MFRLLSVLVLSLAVSSQAGAEGKVKNGRFGEYFDYGTGYEMPEQPKRKPNKATLQTYLQRYIDEKFRFLGFEISPSSQPYEFEYNLREEKVIKEQLKNTALLSYLLYEDGKIVVDELTPKNRFGSQVNNNTALPSRSIGKSFTSYLSAHAICSGYIKSVDAKIDDWDLIKGTVYEGQALIDLVNMRAGDQEFAFTNRLYFPDKSEEHVRFQPLALTYKRLNNTQPSKRYYNYNDLAVNTVVNYIRYKTGYRYQEFTTNFLQNKIGIADSFYIKAVDNRRAEKDGVVGLSATISNFSASRYDFLRIARSMLDDWQNDTCEGKYLKTIFERQMPKDRPDKRFQRDIKNANWPNHSFKNYGGYFHIGLTKTSKKRHIIGMDGFGGQMILIDFDEGRIVVTNAIYNNFNWKKIVRDVIRKGKISSGNWN